MVVAWVVAVSYVAVGSLYFRLYQDDESSAPGATYDWAPKSKDRKFWRSFLGVALFVGFLPAAGSVLAIVGSLRWFDDGGGGGEDCVGSYPYC